MTESDDTQDRTREGDTLTTDVLEQWLHAQLDRATPLLDATMTNRQRLIERWHAFTNGEPFVVTAAQVEAFIPTVGGVGPQSRYLILGELHRFYAWARAEGHTRSDPTRRLMGATHQPPAGMVDLWVAAMRRRGLAESTIDHRVKVLGRWWTFTDGQPFAATHRDVERFIDHAATGAAKSRYTLVSHLHRFYVWARREELTDTDPTVIVERPRLRPGLPRPMHDTDLSIALTVATGHHRAAVLLAATSGLRCIELARLRWIDVLDDRLLLHGKGSKDRIVPLHPAARAALDDLPRTTDYVLPWRGSPRSPGSRVSQEINGFLHSLGINETAHTLRHWCATKAYQATRDLRAVQELLGHASIANTAIYAAFDVEHLRSVVEGIPIPVTAPPEPAPAARTEETVAP